MIGDDARAEPLMAFDCPAERWPGRQSRCLSKDGDARSRRPRRGKAQRGKRSDAAGIQHLAGAHDRLAGLDVGALPPDVLSRFCGCEDPDLGRISLGLFDHDDRVGAGRHWRARRYLGALARTERPRGHLTGEHFFNAGERCRKRRRGVGLCLPRTAYPPRRARETGGTSAVRPRSPARRVRVRRRGPRALCDRSRIAPSITPAPDRAGWCP